MTLGDGEGLYILDESTTGLHMSDVGRLLKILDRLVDGGSTVIVIEHNLDVIANADWIIDMGPEAGRNGGKIVFLGQPIALGREAQTLTGRYLAAKANNLSAAMNIARRDAPFWSYPAFYAVGQISQLPPRGERAANSVASRCRRARRIGAMSVGKASWANRIKVMAWRNYSYFRPSDGFFVGRIDPCRSRCGAGGLGIYQQIPRPSQTSFCRSLLSDFWFGMPDLCSIAICISSLRLSRSRRRCAVPSLSDCHAGSY